MLVGLLTGAAFALASAMARLHGPSPRPGPVLPQLATTAPRRGHWNRSIRRSHRL